MHPMQVQILTFKLRLANLKGLENLIMTSNHMVVKAKVHERTSVVTKIT